MALWQFTVLAALSGILLIHAIVLTLRIGRTNAALKRIEEALLARAELAVPATSVVADAARTEEVAQVVGVARASEEAAALSDTGRLKTLRDLRSASTGRPDSQSSFAMNPASRVERRRRARLLSLAATAGENETPVATTLESQDAPNASPDLPQMHASHGDSGTPATATFEIHDAPGTSGELPSVHAEQHETADFAASRLEGQGALNTAPDLPAMHANRSESEPPAAASFEFYGAPDAMVELSGMGVHADHGESDSVVADDSQNRDTANTDANANGELPDSPATAPVDEESAAAKRARDTLFMLYRQRRRRRERQGF
jgi:hypothetical protein